MTDANASVMRLGDVAEVKAGFGFPEYLQGKTTGLYPFYKVGDISEAWKAKQVGLVAANHYVDDTDLATLKARPLPAGAIVFAKIGAAIGLNRRCVLTKPALVDNNVFGLVPKPGVASTKYLFQFMCSVDLMPLARATTVPSLRKGDVEQLHLPVPSLARQQQIADYLDEQLSRLDACVAALHRVQANLKRYRASVLKSACEGRLVPTEAELARQEGRDFESGAQLLRRMVDERRRVRTSETRATVDVAPDLTGLGEPPAGWAWASGAQALDNIEAGKSFKCEERPPRTGEVGVLKVSAVSWSEFDEEESKTCINEEKIDARYMVRAGDFLFSRANTIELVGACVIVNNVHRTLMLSDKTLRFSVSSAVIPQWLLLCLRSQLGRDDIERLSTGNQESMRNIGQARIRQIRIPVPPLAEQHRIVAEADRRLSLIRVVEAQVAANLARAQRLRQSILQAAFRTPAQAGQ